MGRRQETDLQVEMYEIPFSINHCARFLLLSSMESFSEFSGLKTGSPCEIRRKIRYQIRNGFRWK